MKILLLNGPNLNMLGKREPEIYGSQSLDDIVAQLTATAKDRDINLSHIQSNSESALIDAVHAVFGNVDGIIINPAAFTHTSVALRDAILSIGVPFVEVHLSNVHAREPFRQHSYFSDVALGVICGCGAQGYSFALDTLYKHLTSKE
ncbi:type II 3-dehydroquinate dehydratase [Alteromonas sp. ASW11-36]|uniref:3-dehydroquinate dehydratase n=1 Tax=Alteromonas arenosi TaxID=3055817 RepID=A0ABT7T177_9ALTE|nr:type II 3-dehydroquinate dehydratase [Alteromonas sp. ASW11-36]MDM7862198.1 type II 3-dehydroquinate dehydratase [Alteromonas sp. ASW11-36]